MAIVGSRKPTAYGRRTAIALASRLGSLGVPIISGLAFGIDATVHEAAIDAGGCTVAVLPGGLDPANLSPRSHLRLAERVLGRGALLSEYADGTPVRKEHYAARNRLISGLARCVVVIEGALPSGSLLTARHAADQGRDTWALPGPIDSPVSAGTNHLIEQGAFPLTNIDTFMETLGLTGLAASDPLVSRFTRPAHVDELLADGQWSAAELEAAIGKLELRGVIRHLGGRYYVRV